jgi:hypothetical protein
MESHGPVLPWLPAHLALVPCGQWWDAITVPQIPGLRILEHLRTTARHPLGPVIWDPAPRHAALYFLVPRGAAQGWDAPGARGLGPGAAIAVPGWDRVTAPDVHWVVPPVLSEPDALCDTADLRAALLAADGAAA